MPKVTQQVHGTADQTYTRTLGAPCVHGRGVEGQQREGGGGAGFPMSLPSSPPPPFPSPPPPSPSPSPPLLSSLLLSPSLPRTVCLENDSQECSKILMDEEAGLLCEPLQDEGAD